MTTRFSGTRPGRSPSTRGDFLPGLYEDWVLEVRPELERQCVDLCDLVCAARTRVGDLAGAVEAARRRIQLQPLEEAGYRTLMQLQADLGDRAGAVSTYHHCDSVLEHELGITPDRATGEAFERLMARPGSAPDGTGPADRAGPGRTGVAPARLVGRSRELGVLQDQWRGAMAGQPGLVVVRGGAGVGKARLVREIAGQARAQGAIVAGSQCFGTAGRLALAPVADWLRNPVVAAAAATLDEAWRTEVDRLVPSRGRSGPGTGSRAMADAWQRRDAASNRSARRSGGSCTGVSPRGSNCCTRRTRTRSRPSSPSSTPAVAGRDARWPTIAGPRRSRRAGSLTLRRSGCTRRRCLSSATWFPGRTGTARNSPFSRAWPRRCRPGSAIRPGSCSRRSSDRSIWPDRWAAGSRVRGMVALWGSQFVQGRTADGYLTATRALALADPGSELSGVAHFGVGGSSISLGMPAEGLRHLRIAAELSSDAVTLSIGTRPRVPASTGPSSPCGAAGTMRPAWGWRTTPWSSTSPHCAAPRSVPRITPSASTPDAPWGDVDHATVAFGMATPSGFLASTGVAGLTLGGGIGYLSRRFGLTVDNLLAADVILADGTFVTASENSHRDLLWALRGGGGNFGIVTSFTFRCHDIGEHGVIIGGPVLYDLADAPEVMRWYRELLPSLPEELSGWIGLLTIPPAPPFPEALWGRKACGIVWCYTGPHDRAARVLEPVRAFGSPLLVGLMEMPFSVLQSAFDALYPAGLQWYWRADFFNEISDAAIEVHRKYGERLPSGHSTMHLYPIDGAVSRVASGATAFAYRDGGWAGVIVGVDPDPANAAAISEWAKDYWRELHPTSAGGAYINFMMNEGQDRVKASYRGNYDRLAQVKQRVRPGEHVPRQPEHPARRL